MKKQVLAEKVKRLPDSNGVYRFLDKESVVIYVGKAKNLKKRVQSYFSGKHDSGKTAILVRNIVDIEYTIVETETDALLLENSLIKQYQPKYNVLLKDDKSYPWICVKNEPFPRVFYTRNVIRDGSKYFGPYTSTATVKTLLHLFKQLFRLRSCKLELSPFRIAQGKYKVCLEYHIGNCKGGCVGEETSEAYNEYIHQIEQILKGKTTQVIRYLKDKMQVAADELDFEKAQDYKNKISISENYQIKSTVVSASVNDVDVYAIASDEKYAFVTYFKISNGAIIQAYNLELKKRMDESDEELLQLAIVDIRKKYHSETRNIVLPFQVSIPSVIVVVPQRGDKLKLLELATRNVKFYRLEKLKQLANLSPQKNTDRVLNRMKTDLRMNELPVHIECFDNSNIQGTNPVAACVVFKNTKPSTSEYRKFNIKTVIGANDFASMEEVVYRRYKRLKNENRPLPQLVIVDGGKGQLSSAIKSLKKLDLFGKIAIIGIAKRLEEIYYPNDPVPMYLDKTSETLKILRHLRDESHRFGITFHRDKRSSNFLESQLNGIDGVGALTVKKMLQYFKSIEKIREAQMEELQKVVGKSRAEKIFKFFQKIDD